MEQILPDLFALGSAEHFLAAYGDQVRCRLPWDILDEHAAFDALESGRRSIASARNILKIHGGS